MTKPTPLEAMSEGRVGFIEDTPTPWTVMKHGWPAILLFAVILAGALVQAQWATAADPEISWAALSSAALAEGRWWTVLSHMVIQKGFLPQTVSLFLLFLAAMTVVNVTDRDWMGGWRMPVVFLVCSLAGAGVHILSGSDDILFGVWPGLLGLMAFYLVSDRGAGLRPAVRDDGRAKPTEDLARLKEALGLAVNVAWFPLLLTISPAENSGPLFALGWQTTLLVAVASGVLVFVVELFGHRVLRRLLRICLSAVVVVLGTALFLGLTQVQTLPWGALIGATVAGALTGSLDRQGWSMGIR